MFQASLRSIVENAQLAAFEISDGIDARGVPALLDSVRASVARTTRALDHLSWSATGGLDGG